MLYTFINLDTKIRGIMVDEITKDILNGCFYEPRSMNKRGLAMYPDILIKCVRDYDAETLARMLKRNFFLPTSVDGHKTMKNINEVVAYNDFNKYYTRAVFKVASENEDLDVEIYRAKYSENPRQESLKIVGKKYTDKNVIKNMLDLFRQSDILYSKNNYSELLKPNSGLSVKLVKRKEKNKDG